MTCSQLFHIFFTIFFTACSWIIHLFHVSSMTLLELVHNLFISCSWLYLLLNCSQLVHWLVHDLFMTFSCLVQDLFTTFSSFFHNMLMTCSHLFFNCFTTCSELFHFGTTFSWVVPYFFRSSCSLISYLFMTFKGRKTFSRQLVQDLFI